MENISPQVDLSDLIVKPFFRTLNWASLKIDEVLKVGLRKYYDSQLPKYYYSNTFLFREQKVDFLKTYFPVKVSFGLLITDFNNLEIIFDTYKAITIVGGAGSGKTSLLRHIFLQTLLHPISKIPVLIELRNFNDYEGNFYNYVKEKIISIGLKGSDDVLRKALINGDFLILLDGFDEINSSKKQLIVQQIEAFIDTYHSNNTVITTRPGSGIENLARFSDFNICPLSKQEVIKFVRFIVADQERMKRILQVIKDPRNDQFSEYLSNPLLLSMFILAFESHPEIPGSRSAFYKNVFDTLYSKHDGYTKSSFSRQKVTKLTREQFEAVLNVFSYLTFIKGKFEFTEELLCQYLVKAKKHLDYSFELEDIIYDLRTSISILVKDGFIYSFPHRSMQEYFAADFISKLPSTRKEKFYKSLTDHFDLFSNDYSGNFLSLCYETDRIFFIKFLLLPNLKKSLIDLSAKGNLQLFRSYIDLSRIYWYTDDYNVEENKYVFELIIPGSLFNIICILVGIDSSERLLLYLNDERSLAMSHMEWDDSSPFGDVKFNFRTTTNLLRNTFIQRKLVNNGIAKEIRNIKKEISATISKFEAEISKNDSSLDLLLDFTN